jgi:hypothetical protein
VQLHGEGLYEHDTVFAAANNTAMGIVALTLGVPPLLACLVLYRRGSTGAGMALIGVVSSFPYAYASMATITAFNGMFLTYTAIFGASFFALIALFRTIDLDALPGGVARLPRVGPAAVMLVAGILTAAVWLLPVVEALAGGGVPATTEGYSTAVTFAVDLAIIVPATLLGGVLILRRVALGYLTTFSLLGIVVFLGPTIIIATLPQRRAAIEFTTSEMVGPIAGFVVVAAAAVWVMVAVLRRLPRASGRERSLSKRGTRPLTPA